MTTVKTGVKNFKIDRRADFPLRLIFKDANNTAVNLTGLLLLHRFGMMIAALNLLTFLSPIPIEPMEQ